MYVYVYVYIYVLYIYIYILPVYILSGERLLPPPQVLNAGSYPKCLLPNKLISGENTIQTIRVEANGRKMDMPVFLCDTSALEGFIHKKALRRVDHYSSMAVLGSYLALEDAGMLQINHQKMAVVIATGYGATRTTFSFLDSIFADGDACASPTLFANSVHNAAAAHISILLKARGPNLTVSQFELSVPSALLSACQWLEGRQIDAVLFGGVDEYCDVLGYSWQRFWI